jgi:hypothetical protein
MTVSGDTFRHPLFLRRSGHQESQLDHLAHPCIERRQSGERIAGCDEVALLPSPAALACHRDSHGPHRHHVSALPVASKLRRIGHHLRRDSEKVRAIAPRRD